MLKCPKCNNIITEICLTSYPPKYEARCFECNFQYPYSKRKNSYVPVSQEELVNYNKENIEETINE